MPGVSIPGYTALGDASSGSSVSSAAIVAPSSTAIAYGGGWAVLVAPKATVVAGVTPAVGTANITAPRATLAAFGGARIDVVAPMIELSALGSLSTYGVKAQAPMARVAGFGGLSCSLTAPKPTLLAVGTAWVKGGAAIEAPAPTLTATGTVSAVASSATLAPMAKVIGYFGAVASIEVAGKIVVAASGTAGATGGATIKAPLYELTASGAAQNYGIAILAAPSARMAASGAAWILAPGAQLTAIGTAVVAVSYEAYALNLKHSNPDSPDELTRYTNYPFDKILRYENSYFGVNATGLYLLEGSTDFADPTPTKVPWAFKTGMTDFDMPNLKTVNWAYFGGRMAPAATVSIHFGDTGEQSYAYATPRGASAQNYRQPFGRGIKSRYYAFEAEGSGELSLDSMMFDIAKLARKV